MKKKILSIILCLAVLLGTVAFSACGNGDKLAELEAQIVELEEKLEQREEAIKQFAKRKIFDLTTAYNLGLLSKDDLMSIAYYHNGGRTGNEQIMPEDFEPQPKITLSEDVELKIKQTYKTQVNDVSIDYIHVKTYFGTYGNCVALRLADDTIAADFLIYDKYTIGEINFINFSHIEIWYNF